MMCCVNLKFQHNIKKIRNNIEKSSDRAGQGTRCLLIDGHKILWEDFKKCYEWDQESHSLPIHQKLTHCHFQLDPASKMRNFLAEDVLNKRMLELMEVMIANKIYFTTLEPICYI